MFFDILVPGLMLGGFFALFALADIINKQNKKIQLITNNLFYYDQLYKEILELKNRVHNLETKKNCEFSL
jgi:hypothetical protein